MENLELTVSSDASGARLDKFIADNSDLSRSSVAKLIDEGRVSVNGNTAAKSIKLKSGDIVTADVPDAQILNVEPQNIPIEIVYEDDDLLVVNKPKGMVVHPAPGNYDGTLVNALLYHCGDTLSGINGVIRPGIVHRIDKDTSGLLIVAKNDAAHTSLALQIQEHSFRREYEAVVIGNFREDEGTINLPLGRSPHDRKKQSVNGLNPRHAVTHYSVIERYRGFGHCKFRLETGRTHQIRVHCAAMGHPVAGDTVYGDAKHTYGLQGQCLHARVIGFVHPSSGEYMEFTSDLPEYFTDFLKKMEQQ